MDRGQWPGARVSDLPLTPAQPRRKMAGTDSRYISFGDVPFVNVAGSELCGLSL